LFYHQQSKILSDRFTLPGSKRLKSRKSIALLFAKAQGVSSDHIRALHYVEPCVDGGVFTGFSAPAKLFRLAVQRNRVKRLMREAWRLQQGALRDNFDGKTDRLIVFLIYRGREIPDQATAMKQVGIIIQKLQQRYVRQGS
jgi:ribonuclease P protein component